MRKAWWLVLVGICCLGLSAYAGLNPGSVPPRVPEAPDIVLPPADQAAPDQVQAVSAWNQEGHPLQAVGFERALDQPVLVDFTASRLPADRTGAYAGGTLEPTQEGGVIWTIRLAIPGAMAARLRLRNVTLPEGCRLSVSGRGVQDRTPFGAQTTTPEADLWSPYVHGSFVSLAVEFPASVEPGGGFEVIGILEILKPKQETKPEVTGLLCPAPGLTTTQQSVMQPLGIPAPPSNLAAASTGLNSLQLTWVDNSTNEKGFKIQRQNGTTGSFKKIAKVVTGVTTYSDSTVTPGQTYGYRVKAYNGTGASSPSNVVTIVAGSPGEFTLRATPGCTGTNPQNVLDWTASAAAASYDVYQNGALVAPGVTVLEYADTAVTAGQNYTYYVVAKNTYGSLNSNTVYATALSDCCPIPSALTLSASPGCSGGSPIVSLSWTAATGATSYNIWRNGVLYVAGQTGTTYTDSAVTAGLAYNYHVVAKNTCGTKDSNTVSATAPLTCCPSPGALILTVTPFCYGGSGFALTWTAASGVPSTTSYDVYKDGILLDSAVDQSLAHFYPAISGSTHNFFIRAYNSCGTTDSNTDAETAPTNCTTYVDDLDPGFSKGGPAAFWYSVTNADCWDGHMWWTTNTPGGPGTSVNYAYWWADLSATGPGNYAIFVYIPCLAYADTTNAGYYIYHTSGSITAGPIYINQNGYCNQWAFLGIYYCYGDGQDGVALGDATLEPAGTRDVGFDAVAWVK